MIRITKSAAYIQGTRIKTATVFRRFMDGESICHLHWRYTNVGIPKVEAAIRYEAELARKKGKR